MSLIIVHRLLQSLVSPPLNSILIMILGLFILLFLRKTGFTIIIVGILSLYIQSLPLTAYILTKSRELPPLTISQIKANDAIVVIGGGINGNGFEYESGVNVNCDTLIRLQYTAFLAKKYPKKLIITSGGYTGKFREGAVMKYALIKSFGVKNPILVESDSRNTKENAEFVAKLLLAKNIHNIILVTEAFHMQRAVMLFKEYGLNPTPASTNYYSNINATTPTLSMIPSANAITQVSTIYHEMLGYFAYK